MAELHKRLEEEKKKQKEWLNQFKPNFANAMESIKANQERKLFNAEIVIMALSGAFLINLLSTTIFDMTLFNTWTDLWRLKLDIVILVISIAILGISIYLFRRLLKKYKPAIPEVNLSIKPEDMKPFFYEERFDKITKCLDSGQLTDFKAFAIDWFSSLQIFLPYMFGEKVNTKPIKEYDQNVDYSGLQKNFVIMAKDYDISHISKTGVKIKLQIKLIPDITYSFTPEGNKSASYGFTIVFFVTVLNPENPDSDKVFDYLYLSYVDKFVKYSAYITDSAFKKLIPYERPSEIIKKAKS